MTLNEVYRLALNELHLNPHTSQETCAFDLSCLFEDAFGVARARLPLMGDSPADPECLLRFHTLCTRYAAGEPLQYLLGEWEFYGLPFKVGPGVLIPRPDTEALVEASLSLLAGRTAPAVADLCAGSGAVAIALAHCRPDARVWALELSEAALPYLRANIPLNNTAVTVLQTDVLTSPPASLPALDLVVSNPPYIRQALLPELQLQVQHEPALALDGGTDGLRFYRAMPALWLPLLKPGGAIAFEVGYDQADAVCALLRLAGFLRVETANDLAGIRRVVYGYKAAAAPPDRFQP